MKFRLQPFIAWVVLLGAVGPLSLPAGGKSVVKAAKSRQEPLQQTLFRTLGSKARDRDFATGGSFQINTLPDTLHIVAIRVDFERDTLSTTTGDGSFYHAFPDTMAREDWVVDPPPHDKNYFKDQLYAVQKYFQRFSRNKLTVLGEIYPAVDSVAVDSTGATTVYPAAYHLPYPIWHINYGNDDNKRLNRTLTQLFMDSWTAAAEDLQEERVTMTDNTLFVVFHAGAGNEFDTGWDTTPHDIPSVYIGPEDLATHVDLPNGVPMQGDFFITEGVILPEMQRQGDIEVGLLGTICTQVGFLFGMPHLYQPDTGDPGIGMFGLMDRGFGGFFGIAPIPPSAWMRAYMGWDSVTVIDEGVIRIGAYHLPDSLFSESLHRLVKVPINSDEYFLLEARLRDPEDDGLTYVFDRDSTHRMILHDDYSIEVEEGFGVPVWVEDHDFDLPASGMLIWHIDERVIRDKIQLDRIQEDRNHRGVSLEEADGSEDIGEEYDFLTPGDGSEYGVREDAWYNDNEIWRLANDARDVVFGPHTVPSTTANSGGASHLAFFNFSMIGDTMSCELANGWRQGDFPPELSWNTGSQVHSTFADLDGDGVDELVLYDSMGKLRSYNGDGTELSAASPFIDLPVAGVSRVAAANIDQSLPNDQLIVMGNSLALFVSYDEQADNYDWAAWDFPGMEAAALTVAGPLDSPHVVIAYNDPVIDSYWIYNMGFPVIPTGYSFEIEAETVRFALLGGEWTDTVAVIDNNANLYIFNTSTESLDEIPGPDDLEEINAINDFISADFDGDGTWDLMASCSNRVFVFWWGSEDWTRPHLVILNEYLWKFTAFDLDGDGISEAVGISGGNTPEVMGIEPAGILTEGTPVRIPYGTGWSAASPLVADLDGNGRAAMFIQAILGDSAGYGVVAVDLHAERSLDGFPLDYSGNPSNLNLTLGQLDDDADLELVMTSTSTGELKVVNIPTVGGADPEILWGMQGGNPRLTNHVATPADPQAGTTSTNLDNAYCWPNPVVDDLAHFRFRTVSSGMADLTVYDLVGREVASIRQSFDGGRDVEMNLDCSGLPSGVFFARLETGGDHVLIRFAVVQ